MKTSDIKKSGKQILKTVFASVLKSSDKTVWKKAIAATRHHIAKLEARNDPATLWAWESALRQLTNKFGSKFIKI